jgi:hypothetical protein
MANIMQLVDDLDSAQFYKPSSAESPELMGISISKYEVLPQ